MKQLIFQTISIIAVSALLILGLVFLTQESSEPKLLIEDANEEFTGPYTSDVLNSQQPMEKTNETNPVAVFTTNRGVFEMELFADLMPITVGNFTKLAGEGYYDGTKFHRVIDGFMIQGGDPNSKSDDVMSYGTGGPGYTIEDEFVANTLLSNVVGTIAMANTGQPNSGGSQFFINVADNTFLDFDKEPLTSKHPVFGRVINGMDVVMSIAKTPTGSRDVPLEPVVIESVTLR